MTNTLVRQYHCVRMNTAGCDFRVETRLLGQKIRSLYFVLLTETLHVHGVYFVLLWTFLFLISRPMQARSMSLSPTYAPPPVNKKSQV